MTIRLQCQAGEEYDFPSRGYSEGQAQFHEAVTRGLTHPPYEAAIARQPTRTQAYTNTYANNPSAHARTHPHTHTHTRRRGR